MNLKELKASIETSAAEFNRTGAFSEAKIVDAFNSFAKENKGIKEADMASLFKQLYEADGFDSSALHRNKYSLEQVIKCDLKEPALSKIQEKLMNPVHYKALFIAADKIGSGAYFSWKAPAALGHAAPVDLRSPVAGSGAMPFSPAALSPAGLPVAPTATYGSDPAAFAAAMTSHLAGMKVGADMVTAAQANSIAGTVQVTAADKISHDLELEYKRKINEGELIEKLKRDEYVRLQAAKLAEDRRLIAERDARLAQVADIHTAGMTSAGSDFAAANASATAATEARTRAEMGSLGAFDAGMKSSSFAVPGGSVPTPFLAASGTSGVYPVVPSAPHA